MHEQIWCTHWLDEVPVWVYAFWVCKPVVYVYGHTALKGLIPMWLTSTNFLIRLYKWSLFFLFARNSCQPDAQCYPARWNCRMRWARCNNALLGDRECPYIPYCSMTGAATCSYDCGTKSQCILQRARMCSTGSCPPIVTCVPSDTHHSCLCPPWNFSHLSDWKQAIDARRYFPAKYWYSWDWVARGRHGSFKWRGYQFSSQQWLSWRLNLYFFAEFNQEYSYLQ